MVQRRGSGSGLLPARDRAPNELQSPARSLVWSGPNLGQTRSVVPTTTFEVPQRNLQLSVALYDLDLLEVE
jgi:hypothetical protein